ncbi:MFS transporter [Actinacidiphila reveromycinica]|nr:MFS transporter [Streptomyces sp. SN-593]
MSTQRTRPGLIVGSLAFVCLAVALLQSLVSPAIGKIALSVHTTPDSAAWALTVFLLSLGICTPVVGRLGDIHGKRPVFLVTLGVVMAGTLLAALADTLWLLLLGRVVQGVAGGLFALSFAIVREELPREKVPAAIGLISALLGLGSGLGVLLAGIIADHLSVHWLFWIPLICTALGLAVSARVLPASRLRASASVNWGAAALMSAGLSAILLAVSRTAAWGWVDARTLGLAAAGAVVLALWVAVENRSASPLVDMAMMRKRAVWPVNLLAIGLGFGLFSALLLVPQYAESQVGFGDSVTTASLMVLPLSAVMLLVGPFSGRLEARYGAKPPAVCGAGAVLAGFVLLAAAHGSRLPILAASALLGLGIGLAFAAMANLVVQAVRPEETGVATGVNTVARTLGGAFGGQVAATLVTSGGAGSAPTGAGFDHAFLAMVVASLVALAAAVAVPRAGRARVAAARSEPAGGAPLPEPLLEPQPQPEPGAVRGAP